MTETVWPTSLYHLLSGPLHNKFVYHYIRSVVLQCRLQMKFDPFTSLNTVVGQYSIIKLFLKCGPGWTVPASSGKLLEMQNISPHPRLQIINSVDRNQ